MEYALYKRVKSRGEEDRKSRIRKGKEKKKGGEGNRRTKSKNGWVENIQRPIGYYDSFKSNMAGY